MTGPYSPHGIDLAPFAGMTDPTVHIPHNTTVHEPAGHGPKASRIDITSPK